MGWDVAEQVAEVNHNFERAVPKDAGVWVRIAKVRPGANAIMEQTLSEATLVYRAGAVEQRQTVHWELVKFTACWLTHIEAVGLEKNGEPIFPVRNLAKPPLVPTIRKRKPRPSNRPKPAPLKTKKSVVLARIKSLP